MDPGERELPQVGDARFVDPETDEELPIAVADMRRFPEVLGAWTPTGLEAGLRRYVDWYLTQPPVEQQLLQNSLQEMARKGLLRGK